MAPLSRADAREIFAILSHCEGLAAGWTAELREGERNRVVAQLNELNVRIGERGRVEKPDPHEVFAIDREFHTTFFDASAGPRLKSLHESVKPQAERYLLLYLNALVDRLEESVDEHESIIQAIAEGDAAAAHDSVTSNWAAAAKRLDGVMQRLGERGTW